jgi:hypothetical protein
MSGFGTPSVAAGTSPAAVYHDGYTSVFTVDAASGHLRETYLPRLGAGWNSQDMSGYGTPPVQLSGAPAPVYHNGYTSVFTVDAASGHLQETYLPKLGAGWNSQDMSGYGTPAIAIGTQPAVVYHDGFTSTYTVATDTSDLYETYLPKLGNPWDVHDLSALYGTPAVRQGS